MKTATACAPSLSAVSGREALIQSGIETTLATMADLDIHRLGIHRLGIERSAGPVAGPASVRKAAPMIALGRAAHLALSNVRKHTLIAEDLERRVEDDEDLDAAIETLVWSSINTMKMVALGTPAWQSIQLLPVAQRRFYPVPPLRMIAADPARRGILVVNHEESDARALTIVVALGRAGHEARCAGRSRGADVDALPDRRWADDSRVHVHVGGHALDAEEIRLVDSWHSERLVVQLDEERISRPEAEVSDLKVEDNVNGIVCATSNDIVAVCDELFEDHVFQRKLIAGGHNSVAPLLKVWQAIAEDLLA